MENCVRSIVPMAVLAGLGELFGGLLFAAGVFMPLASLLIVGTMFVAIVTVTGKNGFAITASGYEYNLTIIAVAEEPGQFTMPRFFFYLFNFLPLNCCFYKSILSRGFNVGPSSGLPSTS
ncbi:MAG: DoxX family membrane protein [Desulfitobacterium sp.]